MSKTAFVLSLPRDLPAAEVVRRAGAEGIQLTTARVHKIRSMAKTRRAARAAMTTPDTKPRADRALTAQSEPGSKAAFVRSLPRELPASEVIRRARAEGMQISSTYVYNLRVASNGAGNGKSRSPRAVSMAPTSARATTTTRAVASSDVERRLRQLVAEVGLTRARAVMAEVEVSFR